MAEGFAGHASVALELADSRVIERRLIVLEERDRIGRDLHDHVIQELFAVGSKLDGIAHLLGADGGIGPPASRSGSTTSTAPSGGSAPRSSDCAAHWSGRVTAACAGSCSNWSHDLEPALGFPPLRHLRAAWSTSSSTASRCPTTWSAVVREALTNVDQARTGLQRHGGTGGRGRRAAPDGDRRRRGPVRSGATDSGVGEPGGAGGGARRQLRGLRRPARRHGADVDGAADAAPLSGDGQRLSERHGVAVARGEGGADAEAVAADEQCGATPPGPARPRPAARSRTRRCGCRSPAGAARPWWGRRRAAARTRPTSLTLHRRLQLVVQRGRG